MRLDRLRYLAQHAKDEKGLAALLVRPDGFVAWAMDRGSETTRDEESVRRWFGEPIAS